MNIEQSRAWQTYLAQNPRSREHAARAGHRVPSGTSRSLLRHPPFPFYVDYTAGVTGTDLDGNTRIDFHNNYTTLVHGHGHPHIVEAVQRQLARGTTYSAPGAQELALAEHLDARVFRAVLPLREEASDILLSLLEQGLELGRHSDRLQHRARIYTRARKAGMIGPKPCAAPAPSPRSAEARVK